MWHVFKVYITSINLEWLVWPSVNLMIHSFCHIKTWLNNWLRNRYCQVNTITTRAQCSTAVCCVIWYGMTGTCHGWLESRPLMSQGQCQWSPLLFRDAQESPRTVYLHWHTHACPCKRTGLGRKGWESTQSLWKETSGHHGCVLQQYKQGKFI